MSLGLWKLSEKMNWEKRWMAWIPGLRYYAFADSMDMRAEGMGCGVLEILYFLMSVTPFASEDPTKLVIAALISLAIIIALYVYRIRIFMRMILLFDLKRRWLICWLLAEWLTVLVLGFGRKYQPHPEVSFQAGWEAGMVPAQITGVSDAMNATTASRNGLSVLLRERTVRELGKKKYLLKDIAMNIPNGSLVLLLGVLPVQVFAARADLTQDIPDADYDGIPDQYDPDPNSNTFSGTYKSGDFTVN
jgi:hypothetical protein